VNAAVYATNLPLMFLYLKHTTNSIITRANYDLTTHAQCCAEHWSGMGCVRLD